MTTAKVSEKMIEYYKGDVKRINHFLKVYSFSKTIGALEKLSDEEQFLLEISALTHDIGIKKSEEKYGSSAGKYQEIEGPAIAKTMLFDLGFDKSFVENVCYLIAHHHTYTNIDSKVYQILVEADFIVNIFEDDLKPDSINSIKTKIFKTDAGTKILENLYLSK